MVQKITIVDGKIHGLSMAIFTSYVTNYQRVSISSGLPQKWLENGGCTFLGTNAYTNEPKQNRSFRKLGFRAILIRDAEDDPRFAGGTSVSLTGQFKNVDPDFENSFRLWFHKSELLSD